MVSKHHFPLKRNEEGSQRNVSLQAKGRKCTKQAWTILSYQEGLRSQFDYAPTASGRTIWASWIHTDTQKRTKHKQKLNSETQYRYLWKMLGINSLFWKLVNKEKESSNYPASPIWFVPHGNNTLVWETSLCIYSHC